MELKLARNRIGICLILIIFLSVSVPGVLELDNASYVEVDWKQSADSGEVMDISYVWQQINGFCYWATLSMALQSIGIQLDLADVFAATGIGFTAGYVRYEDIWMFLSGSMYRQQSTLATAADLFGFEVEFYLDTDSTDIGLPFSLIMESYNVNWTEIDGWDDAFQVLKDGIDSGYPVEVYVNLQNLPAPDYDLVRDFGLNETVPTHSILITGYNETSGTAQIIDPGIGLFDNPASFPNDGSWYYEINLTSLNKAWLGLYGTTIIKPGSRTTEDFSQSLANYIAERLHGDRISYAPGSEDLFFWNFGSNAFRAMAADLTDTGLSLFIDEFDEYDLHTRSIILQNLGFEIEKSLTLQYESYRAAIDAIPKILPDLDLQSFVSEGKLALEHLEVFADNSTVNTPFYTGGVKMMTNIFESIAYQYEYIFDGDLSSSVSVYEEDLAAIRTHLTTIADVWDVAADALEKALLGHQTSPPILLSVSIIGVVVLVIAILRRKSSM